MDLYARINILDGRAVRLPHGDLSEVIALDDDPVNRARGWIAKGVDRLHVVDLDAAAYGDKKNRPVIEGIIKAVDVPVQVGGGIRSEPDIAHMLEIGAWRVSISTLPIVDQVLFWELNRKYPRRLVVALDVTDDLEIVIKGWTERTGQYLEQTLIELSSGGAAGFMLAEVGRDALAEPPNFEALEMAIAIVDEPVVAAGGVRDLDDVARLTQLSVNGKRLGGLVVGREVTEGRFTIEEAARALESASYAFGPWTRADLDKAVMDYAESGVDLADADAAATFVAWLLAGGAS